MQNSREKKQNKQKVGKNTRKYSKNPNSLTWEFGFSFGGEGGIRTLADVYFDAPRQSSLAKIQQAAGGTLILTEE